MCVHRFLCVCLCLVRDIQQVLRDDLEKLRHMQKSQPRFSEEQKRELAEVHPWVRGGGLPKAINIEVNTQKKSFTHTTRRSFYTSKKSLKSISLSD